MTGGDVSRFQRRGMPRAGDPSKQFANAMGAAMGSMVKAVASAPGGLPVQSGPVVRVTRGKTTTLEQAGR